MEYQFEVVQGYDQKRSLEFNYRVWCRKSLYWGVVCIFLTALNACRPYNGLPWWISVTAGMGLVVHYFTWPYRMERKRTKNFEQYYDGNVPPVHIRFGDQIFVEDEDSASTLEYGKIDRIYILKRSIVLSFVGHSHLLVDKNAFNKGTFDQFKQFLGEKCPDVDIPD